MNIKLAFSFFLGLVLGLAGGYIATDLHYRHLELAPPSAPAQAEGAPAAPGQMPEIHNRIKVLEDLLAKEPDNLNANVELGNMYYDSGQYPRAIPFYQKALGLKAAQPDVLADLGTCFRKTGEPAKAVSYYDQAFALDSTHWKSVLNALVVSIQDLKDKPRAQRYLDSLRKLNPPEVDFKAFQDEIQKLP